MTVDRRVVGGIAAALTIASAIVVVVAQGGPPAPWNLTAAVQGSTVSLAWAPGANTVAPFVYHIEVGSVPGASDLAVSAVQSPGVVVPNVPDGRYWVRIRTVNAAGSSGPSNEVEVRVGCATMLPAPVGLVSQVSGNMVGVTWQPTAGATSYVLEAGSAPGAT